MIITKVLYLGKTNHFHKKEFTLFISLFEFSLDYSLKKLTGYMKFITEFLGGPVIGIDSEEERHVLVGTVHGAFANCKKYLPGMFVEVDDYNVLEFLQKEVFGSGLYNYKTHYFHN